MSERARPVSSDLFDYIAARTTPEDEFCADLKRAADAAGIPRIWVAPEQAAWLEITMRAIRAKDVVEVGTLAGYSAIRFARGLLPGGKVRTVEVSPEHAAFAREWAARSDVADRIEIHEGDARAVLKTFASESADAAFIDADKAGYPTYFEECLRILRPGGLLMADNAFAFGELLDPKSEDESVHAIRSFNELVAARKDLDAIIVPFGDGCWMGVKR